MGGLRERMENEATKEGPGCYARDGERLLTKGARIALEMAGCFYFGKQTDPGRCGDFRDGPCPRCALLADLNGGRDDV